MTTLACQRVLARLVVDDTFHRQFSEDREASIALLALTAPEREQVSRLDLPAFDRFREVVRGSRVRQFALFFRLLCERVADERRWSELVLRFQSDVVIKDSRDFKDAEAFSAWLASEHPGSLGAELAAYEVRLLRISAPAASPRDGSPSAQTYRKHPCVETLLAVRSIEELQSGTEPLWSATALDAPSHHFVLKSWFGASTVEVLEGPAIVHHALELLRRPRTLEVVRERLGVSEGVFDELWSSLLSSDLVVDHG